MDLFHSFEDQTSWRKMAFAGNGQRMANVQQNNEQYLSQLQEEKKLLDSNCPHAGRLVSEEIDRIQSGGAKGGQAWVEVLKDKNIKLAEKVRIPAKEFPKFNFVGRLLGPKGVTLQRLQQETGVKMSVMGRGSMKDKRKEEDLRKQGGKYSHLNDDLHVLVEVFAPPAEAHSRVAHAFYELKKYMNPMEEDEIHQEQMEQMQFMAEEVPAPTMPAAPRGRGRGAAPGRGAVRGARGAGMTSRGATRGLRGVSGMTRGSSLSRGGSAMSRASAPVRPAQQQYTEESYDDEMTAPTKLMSLSFQDDGTTTTKKLMSLSFQGYEETYSEPYQESYEQSDSQYYDYGHGSGAAAEEYEDGYQSYGGYDSYTGDGWSAQTSYGKVGNRGGRGTGESRSHPYGMSSRGNAGRY